jgi:2-keto-4-pentenoate hydratase/2-oxohepta-3-ene-1,7-dioic acid hydratase in catechol pathway
MAIKLASFSVDGQNTWGLVTDGGVINLGAREGGSVLQLLNQGLSWDALAELQDKNTPDLSLEEVDLSPPVVCGSKIICIGVNYANRNAEYKDNTPDPEWPSLFMRAQESFTGSGQALWRPPESEQLDYEGEIALVIGRRGHRIPQDQAMDYVAGYTLMNEGTIRDWVRHAKFNVTQGKNFSRIGSIGPYMVSPESVGDFRDLSLETHVNGEMRQSDTTANLMFPFDYLISYLSIFYTLQPGDIISTGTPNGAGARFDPPKYLVPGDVVEVRCPSIGVLANTVEDDPSTCTDLTDQLRSNRQG